jgi:hypothetical protein
MARDLLTNDQAIEEIKSRVKPYVGIMSQSQFSTTCTNIQNEISKIKTAKTFFGKFGYTGDWNAWKKINP